MNGSIMHRVNVYDAVNESSMDDVPVDDLPVDDEFIDPSLLDGSLADGTSPARATPERVLAQGYRSGDRHGWLARFCGLLERIGHGRDAAALLEEISSMPVSEFQRRAIVPLPMWLWAVPVAAPGRKGRALDGGQLLLPLKVTWSTPSLVLVASNDDVTALWKTVGYGRSARGTTNCSASATKGRSEVGRVRAGDGPVRVERDGFARSIPEQAFGPAVSRRAAVRSLKDIAEDGHLAWWEAAGLLEPWVEKSLRRAHSKISHEFDSGSTNGRYMVLSDATIETLANHMWLGGGGENSSGSVERLLNRCLHQDFASVDPMRYAKDWLRRDAEQAIRRGLDDPKHGSKVRRLASVAGTTSHEELLAAYREQYPTDEVGIGRIERAMSVCADPMAERSTLDEMIGGSTDVADPKVAS